MRHMTTRDARTKGVSWDELPSVLAPTSVSGTGFAVSCA